jgi:AcrR family transcriptional regulator
LDAVERICTDRSPSTLTMRSIAAEAGVSLGAAYNHFESKEELIGAALDRLAPRLTALGTSASDPAEALAALLHAMRENAAFPRLLTWLLLEGRNVSDVMTGHPLMRDVAMEADRRGASDPATTAMLMGLLAIGTFTYEGMLNRSVGRDVDDQRLLTIVLDVYEGYFPGPTGER